MDFSHYTDDAVTLAVDLVNEPLERVRDVDAFVDTHCIHRGRVTSGDVGEINVLQARLREVFEAAASGDDRRAGRLLNALIDEAEVRPEVTDHDGEWHLHYTPVDAAFSRRLTAATAMALAGVLVSFGGDRFKVCGADDCDDVFVDTSRNTSRRYCGDRCANRANVAAFRARKRTNPA